MTVKREEEKAERLLLGKIAPSSHVHQAKSRHVSGAAASYHVEASVTQPSASTAVSSSAGQLPVSPSTTVNDRVSPTLCSSPLQAHTGALQPSRSTAWNATEPVGERCCRGIVLSNETE